MNIVITRWRSAVCLMELVLVQLCACAVTTPEGRLGCTRDADCPNSWHCRDDRYCYAGAEQQPTLDASSIDSSATPDSQTGEEIIAERVDAGADAGTAPDASSQPPAGSGGAGVKTGTKDAGPSAPPASPTGGAAGDIMAATSGMGGAGGASGQGAAGAPASPPRVVALGELTCSQTSSSCERSAECVSDQCLITVCEPAGTFCDGPAECCDLACNGGVCKCGTHSAACSSSGSPCCSGLYCETGQCATCKAKTEACVGAYQCCGSTDCYQGTCQCRPSGASCNSQSVCCSGTVCDAGICQCRAEGDVCGSGSVCCSGSYCKAGQCVARQPLDTPIKTIDIRAALPVKSSIFLALCTGMEVGDSCTTASDCCSQNCFDGRCVEACRKVGEAAEVDSQCCSRLRANEKCAYAGCEAPGDACTAHQNCCKGSCVNGICAVPF